MRHTFKTMMLSVGIALFFGPSDLFAFDYLEHSYNTDLACDRAQTMLIEEFASTPYDPAREIRFLALSLYCPTEKTTTYCRNGYKQARAVIVGEDSFPATLGDLAALPDHESRYGAIADLPRAQDRGTTDRVVGWIARNKNVSGIVYDVAEDACEYPDEVPWSRVELDVDQTIKDRLAGIESVQVEDLVETARLIPTRGPKDPPMKYSFDNPHYLDLVLRNHTHFGAEAYSAWRAFHVTALDISARRCEVLLPKHQWKRVASAHDLDDGWSKLDDSERATRACLGFERSILSRVARWKKSAPPDRVAQLEKTLQLLASDADARAQLTASVIAIVLEGTGLHFLQDVLAGGHMRTIRSREALIEVRHDHDHDNRFGVVASVMTVTDVARWVAFGDGYLLGQPLSQKFPSCTDDASVQSRTDCLVRHQRGWLVGATMTSLVDFVSPQKSATLQKFVDTFRPLAAPDTIDVGLDAGTLPVQPPRFSYESFNVRLGYEPTGKSALIGLELRKLDELDRPAHWMTSFDLGFLLNTGGERDTLTTDLAFSFHYRFYARVMLDLIPFVFGGIENLGGPVEPIFGAGPGIGLTVLPEGFTTIPLEARLNVRVPFVFYDGKNGFFHDPYRAHWTGIAVGLAFMH